MPISHAGDTVIAMRSNIGNISHVEQSSLKIALLNQQILDSYNM
jgi:hypothetical protein